MSTVKFSTFRWCRRVSECKQAGHTIDSGSRKARLSHGKKNLTQWGAISAVPLRFGVFSIFLRYFCVAFGIIKSFRSTVWRPFEICALIWSLPYGTAPSIICDVQNCFFSSAMIVFHRVRAYLPAKPEQRNIFGDFRVYVCNHDLRRGRSVCFPFVTTNRRQTRFRPALW